VTYTSYKAINASRKVVFINPKNTSKICSNCEMLAEKDLSEMVQNCPFCSLSINRDLNAAKTFSDWDYNLFVKSIGAPHFNEGSSHALLYIRLSGNYFSKTSRQGISGKISEKFKIISAFFLLLFLFLFAG